MENIIVGTKDCPIQKIVKIVDKSSVVSQLCKGWPKLALYLETPSIEKIKLEKQNDVLIVFEKILDDWKLRRGKEATLAALLKALRECKYYDFADRIEADFASPCESSPEEKLPESELRDYLDYNFVTLVDKTRLNNEIINELETHELLGVREAQILRETTNPQDQSCFFWKTMTKAVTKNEEVYDILIKLFQNDSVNHRNGVFRILNCYYHYGKSGH